MSDQQKRDINTMQDGMEERLDHRQKRQKVSHKDNEEMIIRENEQLQGVEEPIETPNWVIEQLEGAIQNTHETLSGAIQSMQALPGVEEPTETPNPVIEQLEGAIQNAHETLSGAIQSMQALPDVEEPTETVIRVAEQLEGAIQNINEALSEIMQSMQGVAQSITGRFDHENKLLHSNKILQGTTNNFEEIHDLGNEPSQDTTRETEGELNQKKTAPDLWARTVRKNQRELQKQQKRHDDPFVIREILDGVSKKLETYAKEMRRREKEEIYSYYEVDGQKYRRILSPSSSLTFTAIPSEIRNMIYELLIPQGKQICIYSPRSKSEYESQELGENSYQGIFCVNKLIRHEVSTYFYQGNTFVVGNAPWWKSKGCPNVHGLKAFISRVPPQYLAMIDKLVFDIWPMHASEGYSRNLVWGNSHDLTKLDNVCRILSKHFVGVKSLSLQVHWSEQTSIYTPNNPISPERVKQRFVKAMMNFLKIENLENIDYMVMERDRDIQFLMKEFLKASAKKGTEKSIQKKPGSEGAEWKVFREVRVVGDDE